MINISQDSHLGHYQIPSECEKNVLVDIGANTGNFTSSQINNFKLIHFYEPYLPCFETIKSRLNNTNNVLGFNEAVHSESNLNLMMMAHSNLDSGSNGLKTDSLNNDWVHEIGEVKTVSLEDVINRAGGRINYMKIDCENSEYYFLINKNLQNIDFIGIELHWHMGEEKYNSLLDHLKKTHITNDDCNWQFDLNKEVLFKNKNL